MKALTLLALMTSCKPGWMWEDFQPATWLNDLKWLVIIVAASVVVRVMWGIANGLFEVLKALFTRRDSR